MSPVTHGLISWLLATSGCRERRDRLVVTMAGLAADLDGLGIVAELATAGSARPLPWYSEYHHWLGHGLPAAVAIAALAAAAGRQRWLAGGLALVAAHLHLLCDLLGSRGPDGHQWPIWYLAPLRRDWALIWSGQWPLASWQNLAITVLALAVALWLAIRQGRSPIELVSLRADAAVVGALRRRFAPG